MGHFSVVQTVQVGGVARCSDERVDRNVSVKLEVVFNYTRVTR